MGFVIGLLAAFTVGFTAHRASICAVKAVAETFTSGRVFLLLSFFKVSLWVFSLSFLFLALFDSAPQFRHWPVTFLSVCGGLLFGAGAAINGACAFGTVTRLGDGDLNFWATVLGWPAGAWLAKSFFSMAMSAPQATLLTQAGAFSGTALWMIGTGCVIWVVWQSSVVARGMLRSKSLAKNLLAPHYRLSAAAALLAIANLVLYAQFGSWSFTSVTLSSVSPSRFPPELRIELLWAVLAVTLLGVFVSAKLRQSFFLHGPTGVRLVRHGASGLAMGFGAAMIPGGNDSLVLYGMASLSPHAVPAYVSVIAGIAMCFAVLKLTGRSIDAVYCSADVCVLPAFKSSV